ncbi:MAG: bifunctional precorrin-2 dehydrogenase/sirohydrochlorin ferrochelatase [Chitinophagaceae bacterium]|nr:bifunctional precorrin-2 dehydrogenase/sirohydrochlorin ferrochelatase [Chitinophagaceae bacterium]
MELSNNENVSAETGKAAQKNPLYPIFLKLENLTTLLVGGGNIGHEKLRSLLSNSPNANITIVAPEISEEVRSIVDQHTSCRIEERNFEMSDLAGKDIVVCATNNRELHKLIRDEARTQGILVNVADTPELCDFYLGSIVQKGNLKIAISTNGKSPTAAKRIKEVLNDALPHELDEVIDQLHEVRNKLNGNFEYKVKKLNEITKILVDKGNVEKNKWRKVATYSLVVFGLMLVGHFIFFLCTLRRNRQ